MARAHDAVRRARPQIVLRAAWLAALDQLADLGKARHESTTTAPCAPPRPACCAPAARSPPGASRSRCIAGLVLALTGRSLSLGRLDRLAARRADRRCRSATWRCACGSTPACSTGWRRATIASLPSLDRALARLGLRRDADGPRPLADRVLGTRQLMQRHGIAVVAQTHRLRMALAMQDWR